MNNQQIFAKYLNTLAAELIDDQELNVNAETLRKEIDKSASVFSELVAEGGMGFNGRMIQHMMQKDSRDFNYEERTARDTFARDAERIISISKENS